MIANKNCEDLDDGYRSSNGVLDLKLENWTFIIQVPVLKLSKLNFIGIVRKFPTKFGKVINMIPLEFMW